MNLFRISALQLKKQFIIVHVKTLKEVSLTNNKAFKYFFKYKFNSQMGSGSGVIIYSDGYKLTNWLLYRLLFCCAE